MRFFLSVGLLYFFHIMLQNFKSTIALNLLNSKGVKTNRKIVVIESDDWGSIRMPDKSSLTTLKEKGFRIEKCAYMLNDCLESNEDLNYLFNFLESRNKTPVITANFLTANPDFERIRNSKFQHYFYENLDDTLLKYPNHDKVKALWLKGLSNKYFIPQLHGREHLNVNVWMKDLQNGNKETIDAFNLNLFGVSSNITKNSRQSYQEAFGKNCGTYVEKEKILIEAHEQFFNLFGYYSQTFIAPNYTWDKDVELILNKLGVTHFQGANIQKSFNLKKNKTEIQRHFLAEENELKQKYLIRNVNFETFSNQDKDWVSYGLKQIKNAFYWKKPAVISMHRVNFIGSINSDNSKRNVQLLNSLLNEIEKKWPEVEYMSSEELSKLI